MERTSTGSVWMDASMPDSPALDRNERADVCVVGAGIAGLSTAYGLARDGCKVIVLDDGPIAGGMTQKTTAHLTNAIDDRYVNIERLHGRDGARLAAASHTAAIGRIEAIAAHESIDCDFERLDGYLFAAPDAPDRLLAQELEAARRAKVPGVEAARVPIASLAARECLRFPRQGQFHPLKYLAGLARAIERRGGRIFCGTRVVKVEGGKAAAQVTTTSDYTVAAAAAVVATNTPINDRVVIHTKQAPYTTYAIAARVAEGSVPRALYWDTADPYHYVRLRSCQGHDLLIVGGEDHKTGQAQDGDARLERLETWTKQHFPAVQGIEFRWSGQVMEPVDRVAFIGRNPADADNVYVATGDSGMGMTHGAIAGMLLTDLIADRQSPWESLYDPARKALRAPLEYAKQNLNVAAQYVEDYLSRGDIAAADELAPGQGGVLRRGVRKVALYRDERGVLHECSAVCPHLGCIVSFNGVEKTWDCPCHGSRFDCYGRVIVGPANRDLEPAGVARRASGAR